MTGTTYLSTGVLVQLARAQAELDRHLVSTPGGRCRTCGADEPCAGRLAAGRTFARFGRLPRRTPGAVGGALWGGQR
ncbi:hypothetical protein ACNTMW_00505 [Planosporangium sp. 12N6]|uniref:hypothetical protein n=1 Tax=Planosporangium spinosum TaxID=3402278 RepID=UPI003CEC0EA8